MKKKVMFWGVVFALCVIFVFCVIWRHIVVKNQNQYTMEPFNQCFDFIDWSKYNIISSENTVKNNEYSGRTEKRIQVSESEMRDIVDRIISEGFSLENSSEGLYSKVLEKQREIPKAKEVTKHLPYAYVKVCQEGDGYTITFLYLD